MRLDRTIAWERAKEELNSIFYTYDEGIEDDKKFAIFSDILRDFIINVENSGCVK